MAAYGRDIPQIMRWTYPQLRMMRRYRESRVKDERRWELILSSGTLMPEMFDSIWQQLGGAKIGLKNPEPPTTGDNTGVGQSGGVDEEGNVVAPAGTPLLSDIALGRSVAPPLIPVTRINKSIKEPDGS